VVDLSGKSDSRNAYRLSGSNSVGKPRSTGKVNFSANVLETSLDNDMSEELA
jgi:hypothetical protein